MATRAWGMESTASCKWNGCMMSPKHRHRRPLRPLQPLQLRHELSLVGPMNFMFSTWYTRLSTSPRSQNIGTHWNTLEHHFFNRLVFWCVLVEAVFRSAFSWFSFATRKVLRLLMLVQRKRRLRGLKQTQIPSKLRNRWCNSYFIWCRVSPAAGNEALETKHLQFYPCSISRHLRVSASRARARWSKRLKRPCRFFFRVPRTFWACSHAKVRAW